MKRGLSRRPPLTSPHPFLSRFHVTRQFFKVSPPAQHRWRCQEFCSKKAHWDEKLHFRLIELKFWFTERPLITHRLHSMINASTKGRSIIKQINELFSEFFSYQCSLSLSLSLSFTLSLSFSLSLSLSFFLSCYWWVKFLLMNCSSIKVDEKCIEIIFINQNFRGIVLWP